MKLLQLFRLKGSKNENARIAEIDHQWYCNDGKYHERKPIDGRFIIRQDDRFIPRIAYEQKHQCTLCGLVQVMQYDDFEYSEMTGSYVRYSTNFVWSVEGRANEITEAMRWFDN